MVGCVCVNVRTDAEKPWTRDPTHKYFKTVHISALAGIKMMQHAMTGVEQGRSTGGGSGMTFEVMGLMVGKIEGDSVVVMDAYPLPVQGAENFVEANTAEMYRYMTALTDAVEAVRR
jgi:COP9 signalosome complex subunit 5